MNLERNLDKMDLPLNKKNIWEDASHAATVRSIADGNETVPTVVIGNAKMVNPNPGQVLQAIEAQAPELLPEGVDVPKPNKMAQKLNKLLGGD